MSFYIYSGVVSLLYGVYAINRFNSIKPQLISPENAKRMDFNYIIDVRSRREWNQGHHPRAIHIPHNGNFSQFVHNVPKSEPVLVYCRTGRRAMIVAQKLVDSGFNKVYYVNKSFA